MCSSYRSNQNPQTVKLSTPSSVHQLAPTSLGARYVSVLTPMRPNRPHIPSTIQFSKSADTKQPDNPNFGLICRRVSNYSFSNLRRLSPSQQPLRSVSVPQPVVSSSVKRYLGPVEKRRKRKKRILSHFLRKFGFIHNFRGLAQFSPK